MSDLTKDSRRFTSFMKDRDAETIKLLLEFGADATITNKFGSTPLHFASSHWQEMPK